MILNTSLAGGLAVAAAASAMAFGAGAAPVDTAKADPVRTRVALAIDTIKVLDRPGRDNLATIWDGDKYVQCRRMDDRSLRCEAGGSRMQPSLAHVLTADHVGGLAAMGWRLDASFGNYVQTFRPDLPADMVADKIIAALAKGYDAEVGALETETSTVASEPCPPRNGPSQNLAGMISDAPSMESVSVHACAYMPDSDPAAHLLPPGSTSADLIKLYGPRLTAEIRRLRVNMHRSELFVAFDTGLGYLQCAPQTNPDSFYCEAQSAESWPALAAALTPDRIARLHAAGFADPGRAPNYSKSYPADQVDDAALAAEILTLLHDVYGYYGASALAVTTEEAP